MFVVIPHSSRIEYIVLSLKFWMKIKKKTYDITRHGITLQFPALHMLLT